MQKRLTVVCLAAALCGWIGLAPSDTPPAAPIKATAQVTPLEIAGVHNAFQLSPKLLTGSQPEGAAAFQALRKLGVKTIITVDGARPDVKLAKKYGLRYVQIPFGYDGLPREQGIAIARAVRDLPGPVYVHCHHGKHRSPVAAACSMIALEGWSNDDALAFLKIAGTGANYSGLWDSARTFKPPTAAEMKKAPHKFPAIAPTAPLVQTMVRLDELSAHLKASQDAKWSVPANSPDVDPPHEALMLREIFTELSRAREISKRPADFRAWLSQGEATATELEAALRAADSDKAGAAYQKVTATCASCHAVYRNVPQTK